MKKEKVKLVKFMSSTHAHFTYFLPFLLVAFFATGSIAGDKTSLETATDDNRPKIGLVLSGGGARGSAHIGVIKVLEEMRIPIDYIVGTSMGSIIGGLYASGFTPDELSQAIVDIDWGSIFIDAPDRSKRSFKRKLDDTTYLVKARPGLKGTSLALPKGLIQGQKLNLVLKRLAIRAAGIHDFDKLRIPFRAVATNIETGADHIFAGGNLGTAMRASMSIPGALAPVEVDGNILVDGGVSNNLPMDVARSMGADILIVVDIGTPLSKAEDMGSLLDITGQLTTILTSRNVKQQLETLKQKDILIQPDLGDIKTADFKRALEAVEAGRIKAEEMRKELSALSVSESEYNRYLANHPVTKYSTQPLIDFIEVDNNSSLSDKVILSRIRIKPGEKLDLDVLEEDLGAIYGLELFQRVDYSLIEKEGKTGLVIKTVAKEWGPKYLQFGLGYQDNLYDEAGIDFSLSYIHVPFNKLGGELRIGGQVGDSPRAFIEFHQPLDNNSRYFISPHILYRQVSFGVYEDIIRTSEYRLSGWEIGLESGRELGLWGEFRFGVMRRWGDATLSLGDKEIVPKSEFNDGAYFARLSVDTLDNANFPHYGVKGYLEFYDSRTSMGADNDFRKLTFQVAQAHTFDRHTIFGRIIHGTTLKGDITIQNNYFLGGFLKLSGFNDMELSGEHMSLGNLIYFYRIDDPAQTFGIPMYVGGSLEAGNVWRDTSEIEISSLMTAQALFFGMDTPIGPVYIASGWAEGGRASYYIFVGRMF